MSQHILEVKNISKQFPGVLALNNVSISLEKGKVHALLGKNGSGKSTIVNIISGIFPPSSGQIYLEGKIIKLNSPKDAQRERIALVHQEMSLIKELSIAENIFLGRYPAKKSGLIDWKKCFSDTEKILEKLSIELEPKSKIEELSIGQQQMIEISKAVATNPKLLILDEPTSALTKHEVDDLFKLVRQLKANGETIIYITHRLDELVKIVDTVSVLRDGIFIDKKELSSITNADIINMMFGDVEHGKLQKNSTARHVKNKDAVLEVHNLSRKPSFFDISFSLYKGEILGIAGMLGSGRSELLRAIYGLDHFDHGEVIFMGQRLSKPNPKKMKQLGFAFSSEDRKGEGIVQELSIHKNLCLAPINVIFKKKFITEKMESPIVSESIEDLEIKIPNTKAYVSTLSGGNQQKVVVGNWLNCKPKVLLFDEPSRGIDVVAKQQIFTIMKQQSLQGVSSILVSTELEELLEVCDRILIIQSGKIINEVSPEALTTNDLYLLCMGE